MRRVLIVTPAGASDEVTRLAQSCAAEPVERWTAAREGGQDVELLLAHLQNQALEGLVEALAPHDGVRLSLLPQGALVLDPGGDGAIDRAVADVTLRSPVEIVVGSLQSVGAWGSFLGYAAASGVVTWVGLHTNTIYLLIASMLIAPFAEPAMTAAIATARGMPTLLVRSLLRYGAALLVSAATAAGMTLLFGREQPTLLMAQVASLSVAAAILPLVAGLAGALNLSQSSRSSLVSGAAPGMLVAAALAPPAGVLGMASVLGEWEMVFAAAYVLVLQLIGIHVAAALLFLLVGLRPTARPYPGGRAAMTAGTLLLSAAALVGLVTLQANTSPWLDRASVAGDAEQLAARAVRGEGATLLEVDARFARLGDDPDTLVVTGLVALDDPARLDAVEARVHAELARALPGTRPAVRLDGVRAR